MKFITAIIQPNQLESVKKELADVDVNLMTITRLVGQKRQKKAEEIYSRIEETGGLRNKVQLDIAISDDFAESTIEAIVKGAHIDAASDNRIFVF